VNNNELGSSSLFRSEKGMLTVPLPEKCILCDVTIILKRRYRMKLFFFFLITTLFISQGTSFASFKKQDRVSDIKMMHEVEFLKEVVEKNSCNPLISNCQTAN